MITTVKLVDIGDTKQRSDQSVTDRPMQKHSGLSSRSVFPATLPYPRTGEAGIDQDHEKIAVLIESLWTESDVSLSSALDELNSHLADHFFQEDKQMRALGGDRFACHLDEHASVLASVREVRERVVASQFNIGRRLATALKRWFPEHVMEMDMRLAQALFKVRTGGNVIQLVGRQQESTKLP